jgi:phosphoribosyl 1,2-cyclic phosphodiesterase
MRVVSLGSGSSGNALLFEAGPNGRTKLLVDAGFSEQILRERLRSVGVTLSQIRGVLITHEHTDHILALSTITNRYTIPVVADPRTLAAIENVFATGILRSEPGALVPLGAAAAIDPAEHVFVEGMSNHHSMRDNSINLAVGTRCVLGDIEVVSFPVSHDAIAPCGYLLSAGGCRVCVVTDSGVVTPTMLEAMNQADLLILESNHDRERLLRGPYPYVLKQRILSSTGHLSNDQAAEAVLRTWRSDAVRWLWLSHLSRTNNTPKLALNHMQRRIQNSGANLEQIHISVLPHAMGGAWDSTQLWQVPSLWEMQL